ncbi:hypothetical protein HAX54_042527 [Datura stramonium]|uniref:Uncharacterized protein n=1 Tax=Datura stramonium TaxID=4076 RepID=A0ABS8VZH8_DATST|nr:hypothetical protein [Datura stramonium]
MEGGEGDGNAYQPYQNLPNNIPIFQQGPPLTAINRFLWSQQSQFPSQQSVANNNQSVFTQCGGFYDFSSCSNGASGINSWTSFPEASLMDSILFNEENALHWNNQENDMAQEMISSPKSSKETRKKAKEGTSSTTVLVKGQWTEEEDRNLVKLVKQFGIKRWAQIAENMVGRAGKQCRERWHNHLRPDIKKDTWSEEEELMLVEAHKQIGNKWAEIGKRIPGRTENAIKNHWNATKRRQNSRRNKLKKQEKDGQNESKYRSNILEDYIRSKYFSDDSPPANIMIPSNSANMTNTTPPYSDDDDSPSLLTNQSYDEEMSFMQKLFGKNSLVENNGKVRDNNSTSSSYGFDSSGLNNGQMVSDNGQDGCNLYLASDQPNMYMAAAHHDHPKDQSYNCSDLYLSYLLDRSTLPNSLPNAGSFAMNSGMVMNQAAGSSASSGGNKEVDLTEMVSSSIYRQNTSNNTFF